MGQIQHQQVNRFRDANASVKAQEVYRLWLRGLSFEAIARAVGYRDASGARKAWVRARAAQAALPSLDAERQRDRERCEIAYAAVVDRVERGTLLAIDRALAILKRKADLLGLDAPKVDAIASQNVRRVYERRDRAG